MLRNVILTKHYRVLYEQNVRVLYELILERKTADLTFIQHNVEEEKILPQRYEAKGQEKG
jgi:hypothetical protein